MRIDVLSGPSLDRLGLREPERYGRESLPEIHARLEQEARQLGVSLVSRQSAAESELIGWIHEAVDAGAEGILINAAAYTHTSIAILDALLAAKLPVVEVHLTLPEARESFRRVSLIAPACLAKVAGFGGDSYLLALRGLVDHIRGKTAPTAAPAATAQMPTHPASKKRR